MAEVDDKFRAKAEAALERLRDIGMGIKLMDDETGDIFEVAPDAGALRDWIKLSRADVLVFGHVESTGGTPERDLSTLTPEQLEEEARTILEKAGLE